MHILCRRYSKNVKPVIFLSESADKTVIMFITIGWTISIKCQIKSYQKMFLFRFYSTDNSAETYFPNYL